MPFRVINGTYHTTGYAPDGDSIRFRANDPSLWDTLEGPKVTLNKDDMAQLRFEAVDALETHYRAGSTSWSQPEALADAAADRVMELLNITNVEWTPSRYRVRSSDDAQPGYILTRAVERYRRPVSFVFAGPSPEPDGAERHLSPADLHTSLNFQLLREGLVYPTFYSGLFYDLRETLARAAVGARRLKRGIWKSDRSSNLRLTSVESITENSTIFPKLFRRLMTHYAEAGTFEGFRDYLLQRRETTVIIKHCHFTHFDNVISHSGKTLQMQYQPEQLLFIG